MQEIQIIHNETHEIYKLDYVSKQASASLLYQNGKTVILASVAINEKDSGGEFVPFSVQYIEKSYAVGRFPGGFVKREGKPGEFEILTSRIIDRTLRPLFPKTYRYPTHVSVLVLSYDGKSDLQVDAMNAAANALLLSEVPFEIPVAGVRVGRVDGNLVINPSPQVLAQSSLDLFVSGSFSDILMIEMKGDSSEGVEEDELLRAISLAQTKIDSMCNEYQRHMAKYKKSPLKIEVEDNHYSDAFETILRERYHSEIAAILEKMGKSERHFELNALCTRLVEEFNLDYEPLVVVHTLQEYKKKIVRQRILKERRRMDGRKLDEIRKISIDTNILPCAHGSALFTRGQTQALVVATIGGDNDAQSKEVLGSATQKDYFTFHYNFPPFSVGEASMISSPSRRELGHGNLARKALESCLLDKTQTVRLVSEILESNGSSSMASVCGGSLALAASGIKTDGLIAGIAMGLVVEGDDYAILSDIMGLEDHDGDMDFKVAGNQKFITAMQMDIKLGGISPKILQETLHQAKTGRDHILSIMEEANKNITINDAVLPKSEEFNIPASRIVEIIGVGGKTIKEIIDRFCVSIDLDRDKGRVKVFGLDSTQVSKAKDFILELIGEKNPYKIGEEFEGRVKRVVDFGVFVELPKGGDGLLHASKFVKNKLEKPNQYFQEGQMVRCVINNFNKGKIDLDILR